MSDFVTGQIPTAAQWNTRFDSLVAIQGGTLVNGTIQGGNIQNAGISGTINGNATWTGVQTFTGTLGFTNLLATGTSALNGATTVGTNSAATSLIRNGPNNSTRIDEWQTAASKRWRWQVDGNESGANAGATLRLFAFDDTGTSLGEVFRFTRATGSATYNNNLSFSDPFVTYHGASIAVEKSIQQIKTTTLSSGVAMGPGGVNPAFYWLNNTYNGTLDTGSGAPNFGNWTINDAVNASRGLPASAGLGFGYNFNAGANGDRIQLSLTYNKLAASLDGLVTSPMCLALFMHNDVNESTNPASPLGTARVANFDGRIGGTGNAFNGILIQENDIRVLAGNTVRSKINLSLHPGDNDAVHGSVEDAALAFTASPLIVAGTGGHKTLMQIGSWTQWHPWDETLAGTSIMQVGSFPGGLGASGSVQAWNPTVTYGFDLWGLKFTTAAFRSQGLTIDGTGQVPVLGPGAITYSASGIKIAVPNVLTTGVAIAAAGTGYRANDLVLDTMGNLVQVTAVTGSTPTAVALVRTNYASAAPTNPVTTNYGCGTGLTLNLTTAATGTLTLGDSGQTVNISTGTLKVGASQMTANGAVATALSSVGPTGSHTTVQEWLTVTNSAGTVRYIPCF